MLFIFEWPNDVALCHVVFRYYYDQSCIVSNLQTFISLSSFSGLDLNFIVSISIGIEARGFIFGPPIALAIGAKFVPLRKPKKLPGIFSFLLQPSWNYDLSLSRAAFHLNELAALDGQVCWSH